MSKHNDLVRTLLDQLGEHPVVYHRIFTKIAGGVCAGIILAQIKYWTIGNKNQYAVIHKTDTEFANDLGMGLEEFRRAKAQVKQLDMLEIYLKGIPAKTHYKLDVDLMLDAISDVGESETSFRRTQKQVSAVRGNSVPPKAETIKETTEETTSETIKENSSLQSEDYSRNENSSSKKQLITRAEASGKNTSIIEEESKSIPPATQKEKKTKRVYEHDVRPYQIVLQFQKKLFASNNTEKSRWKTLSEKNNSDWPEKQLQAQADSVRKLLEIDKIDYDEIEQFTEFVLQNDWWLYNCTTMHKIREWCTKIQNQIELCGKRKNIKIPIENEEIVDLMINAWICLNPVKDYIMDMKMIKQYFEPAAKKMERFFRGRNVLPKEQVSLVFRCLDQNRPKDGKHEEWILNNTKLWNKLMPKYMDE